ncbi:MAG TPA: glycosyltransferase family 2 protein [Acidimicrobiales bacterium]|nr:glycosyltransferase family 2 protein [Acidimicrobiales bacterium]
MSEPAARAAAIVVNYNTGAYLLRCVRGLTEDGVGEVVVVDNASTDGSIELLEEAGLPVRVIRSGDNRGYGGGANIGINATESELVLVANADLEVKPGGVARLVVALDTEPELGIVGPRITAPDGALYPSARTFPNLADSIGHAFLGIIAPGNRWSRRYKMLDWDHGTAARVDWVSGACFVARREVIEKLGGFDEDYFMYGEDVDLCWRARQAAWEVGYEPRAEVVHVQGVSADRHPYRMIAEHHRSLLRFADRTTVGWRRTLLPVVAVGLVLRTVMAWAQRAVATRPSVRARARGTPA